MSAGSMYTNGQGPGLLVASDNYYRFGPLNWTWANGMSINKQVTIGELFNRALTQLHEVLAEANKQMWKQVMSEN